MSADITLTRSGEFDVTQAEGNTPDGLEFVDAWVQAQMIVVDLGRIIIREEVDVLERAALLEGLTVERAVLEMQS